jgi:adenylate cyclase
MAPERWSGTAWIRPLRLWCGLILFTYLLTHFTNHALGLVSLDAMAVGRVWFLSLWRNPVGTSALYGALLTHWLLGLWLLYKRRTLRMPIWEATQILFGLSVPPLLVYHFVGTRLAYSMFGAEDVYPRVVLFFWVTNPWTGFRQSSLLVIAWAHGCIGLHFWLRLRPWYRRSFPLWLSAFVLVPVLAFLGFAEAGREVTALARDPGFVPRLMVETRNPSAAQRATLLGVREAIVTTVWGLLVLTVLARAGRAYLSRRRGMIRLSYPDGRSAVVPLGWTVLEASRYAGIPHASVCGGRGRCSTCRIRVSADPAVLPPPSTQELRVLQRVSAAPNVRLACQLRPTGDLSIVPLLLPTVGAEAGPVPGGYGKTRYLTAVGDTVHVASRLEALTKEYECELVVSEQVMARAGLSAPEWPRHDLTVRNREAPLRIVVVKDARYLVDRILAGDDAERQRT